MYNVSYYTVSLVNASFLLLFEFILYNFFVFLYLFICKTRLWMIVKQKLNVELPFSVLHSRRARTRYQLWHCKMLQKVWRNKIETWASSELSWTLTIVRRVTNRQWSVSVKWCCVCFGNTWWPQWSILLLKV